MRYKINVLVIGVGSIGLLILLVILVLVIPAPRPTIQTPATPIINTSSTVKNTSDKSSPVATTTEDAVLSAWFMPLVPITVGTESLQASIADTETEREMGLSGTPYLPVGIVKLFVFERSAPWGFWMKDMLYPIDILWLDENKVVVHIEPQLSPDTYPTSYESPTPARYVIEVQSGFSLSHHIVLGTKVTW